MGRVYKARHVRLGRVVALKLIAPDRLTHPQAVERFFREARAAAQLAHPNIVVAYDADQAGDTPYFAMEFVEGTDLARLVRQVGRLSVAQACDYARQVALGLQHAHECGLVHRDIKPSNIMVAARPSADGRELVKILDLGLARLGSPLAATDRGRLTQDGAVMGTPDYLAPEQAVDSHRADIRADIYSLGCTLYHLLAGHPPFPEASLAQKLLWQQQAEPTSIDQLRPDVPPGLAAVLRQMMAKQPEKRFPTPAAVATALAPFCGVVAAAPADSQASTVNRQATDLKEPSPATSGALPATRVRGRNVLIGAGCALGALAIVPLVILFSGSGNKPELDMPRDRTAELKDRKERDSRDRADSSKKTPQDGNPDQSPADKISPAPDVNGPWRQIPPMVGHTHGVLSVALLPGGRRALSCSMNEVILWDTSDGSKLRDFSFRDQTLESLREPDLRKRIQVCPISSIAISGDGRRALLGGSTNLILWDLERWKKLDSFPGGEHTGSINSSVAIAANGKWGLHTDQNAVVRIWDLEKRNRLTGGFVGHVVCLSYDGNRVLTGQRSRFGGIADMVRLHLYDVKSREQIGVFGEHRSEVVCVAISAHGKRGLSAGRGDNEAILWNLDTFKPVLHLKGHTKQVQAVAISPDGRLALSGSDDTTVRLWNLATGKEAARFTKHSLPVNCVAFSPGGRLAVSGSEDQTVGVWMLPKEKS
jgi:serine/threonine protein kinase